MKKTSHFPEGRHLSLAEAYEETGSGRMPPPPPPPKTDDGFFGQAEPLSWIPPIVFVGVLLVAWLVLDAIISSR